MKKILTARQKKFLEAFRASELSKHFYWSGGTLLAYYYLQHRFSEDLDFFSEDLFPDEFIAAEIFKIKKMTGAIKITEHKKLNRHQFVFNFGKDSLKIEFVYFPFPSIEPKKILRAFDIKIDSLKDITANKIHAAFERSEPKDVFDLYFILKKDSVSFTGLFGLVEQKFGVQIDPVSFGAKVLSSAAQLQKIQPLIFSKKKHQMQEIEIFFRKATFSYLKKQI